VAQDQDKASATTATPSRPAKPAPSTSLANPFNVAVAALVLLCLSVFWLISSYTLHNVLRQQADSLGPKLAQQAAALVTDLVLANDLISMNVVLNQLTRDSVIAEAAVLDIDGTVTAVSRVTVTQPRSLIPLAPEFGDYYAPISLQDSTAGEVRVRLDLSYIEAALLNNLLFLLGAALLLIIVAVSLSSSYFGYLVTFPLKLLALGLQRIRKGDIDVLPEPRGNNELSKTLRQFNATAEFLAQATFLQDLSEQMKKITAEGRWQAADGQPLEASVLWVRIANFTYLASTHDEATMVNLLNRYYFICEKVSRLYNGQLSGCQEGEVVISFSHPELEDEQSFYAICAAQLLLHLAPDIGQVPGGGEALNLKLRIAVHSGQTSPGLYSPMTGLADNVTGRLLDVTREICDECPDHAVLVSAAALQLAGADTRVQGEEFSIVDDELELITYVCNEPMAGFAPLMERQAQLLSELISDPG
jgi:uncharacterized membrane protein affecting hemolysin expression/class 3 adenylate cyclase